MSDKKDSESSFLQQEQSLLKELEKTYANESALMFGQIKRRFEDEVLKQNRVLKDEFRVYFFNAFFLSYFSSFKET